MVDRLLIRGFACGQSGWGLLAVTIVEELIRQGVEVEFWPLGSGDLSTVPAIVRDCIVTGSDAPGQLAIYNCKTPLDDALAGRETVFMTMWETDRPPADAVARLNRFAAVVVPSEFNLVGFHAAGLNTPCFKVPLFVRETFLQDAPFPPGACTFTAAGREIASSTRKNLGTIARAFLDAFADTPEARLRILTSSNQFARLPASAKIEVETERLSEPEIATWMAQSHVFVNASHAEGWGFFPLQAMALGRPVISHLYSGPREYLKRSWGFEVTRWESVPATGWHAGRGYWSAIDFGGLRSVMRKAYFHQHLQQIGETARSVARYFRPSVTAERLLNLARRQKLLF